MNKQLLLAAVAMAVAVATVAMAQDPVTVTACGGIGQAPCEFSIGTWAGEVLKWAATAFLGALATGLAAVAIQFLKWLGLKNAELLRDRLQQIIVNGLNDSAAKLETRLEGRGKVEVKSQIGMATLNYVRAHGADTIKALGLDPNGGKLVEAVKARIETALNDPATPTPPSITPPEVKALTVPTVVAAPRVSST